MRLARASGRFSPPSKMRNSKADSPPARPRWSTCDASFRFHEWPPRKRRRSVGRWQRFFYKIARMKKAKAVPKTGVPKTVDEYLAGVPEPARSTLNKVRAVIRSVVPAETTETISYGIPTFKYKGSLVAFGAFTKHCSLFPMGASVLNALATGRSARI